MTAHFDDFEACVDWILQRVGSHIVMATPLGLGKPNGLLNALYRRVKADSGLHLKVYTALSLARPAPAGLYDEVLAALLLYVSDPFAPPVSL